MAEAQMGAAGKDPDSYRHPIDSTGGTLTDLPLEYANGLHLHADSAHLADVAKELHNILIYIGNDLADAAQAVTDASTATPTTNPHGKPTHGTAADPSWTNPAGLFADANHVWASASQQAARLNDLVGELSTTVSDLAKGTQIIAKRYRDVEERNKLSAKKVEGLLGITSDPTSGASSSYASTPDPTDTGSASQGTSSGYAPSGA